MLNSPLVYKPCNTFPMCKPILQSSSISTMEFEQSHQFFEQSYHIEQVQCSSGTATILDIENLYSLDIIQDTLFNDQSMKRLLQIETELLNETGLNRVHVSSSGEQSIQELQEEVWPCPRGNQFNEFWPQEGENEVFDLLMIGAKAIEDSNWLLACNTIGSLTNIESKGENMCQPHNDMVSFFAQGLYYKCMDACHIAQDILPSQKTTASTIKMLLEQSPHVTFTHFTANQAILEAVQDEDNLHVIDLDIMEGIQWPPLMTDLAMKENFSMRITAVIMDPKEVGMTQQTGKRLAEFAASLGLGFQFNQVLVSTEEDFDRIKVNHTTIANCAFRQLHMPIRDLSLIRMFLNGINRLSPKMVVLAEEELLNFAKITSMSFEEFFSEAFRHYTAVFDSLAHSFPNVGFRLLGRDIMGLRIIDCLRKFPIDREEKVSWKGVFSSFKCLKPRPVSPYSISQAKLLAGAFGRGYWVQVQNQNSRFSLSWNGRPLATVSVWHT